MSRARLWRSAWRQLYVLAEREQGLLSSPREWLELLLPALSSQIDLEVHVSDRLIDQLDQ